MVTFHRTTVFYQLVTAWLLLTSVYNAPSVVSLELPPQGGGYHVTDHTFHQDQDDAQSTPIINNLLKPEHNFKQKLQSNAEKDTTPAEEFSHTFTRNKNISKRDFHPLARMRALVRVEAPCAGGNQHSVMVEPPTAASPNISPQDLLMALGIEAAHAKKVAINIIRKYESLGMDAIIVGMLGSLPAFSLNIRGGSLLSSTLRPQTSALSDIYRHLGRAALYLEAMADDSHYIFTPLIEDLKENGIYNLLCGTKIVLNYRDAGLHHSHNLTAFLSNTRILTVRSAAQRLARNYIIITQVAELLGVVSNRLTLLATL